MRGDSYTNAVIPDLIRDLLPDYLSIKVESADQTPKAAPMRFFVTLITLSVSLLTAAPSAQACTIIAAGKLATADGSVLVSQTDTGQDSRIYVVHGREYPEGETAPVYFGIQDATNALEDDGDVLGRIPQARRTYTYFHNPYNTLSSIPLSLQSSHHPTHLTSPHPTLTPPPHAIHYFYNPPTTSYSLPQTPKASHYSNNSRSTSTCLTLLLQPLH